MKILQVLFLIALAIPALLAASVLETDQSQIEKDVQESQTTIVPISEEHFEGKINWGPVWDDIDGSNEFVLRNYQEKENCWTDETKGLINLFKESKKLLPLKEIKEIVDSYANDAEFKALKAFVGSAEYKEKVQAIRNSEEYKILKSYSCLILHINLEDSHFVSRHVLRATQESGIRGLIHKIHSILPHQKLKDLYNRLIKSDNELVKALAHLKSDEFKQILLNLRNNVPAYKELKEKLIAIGVPVDELKGVISSVLGWNTELENLP